MERLLVVRCPDLLEEDEGGAVLRTFADVIDAVGAYCPWTTAVRPGVCSLPARGPARYFGGEDALVELVLAAAGAVAPVQAGLADGLFAAVEAARRGVVVPAGGTPGFLAPLPVDALCPIGVTGLLDRLGIRTLGAFAALPEAHVLGRFGADGALCHRVAGGQTGEAAGLREPRTARSLARLRRRGAGGGAGAGDDPAGDDPAGDDPADGDPADGDPADGSGPTTVVQAGFWGGTSDADARAARCLASLQELLGPEAVVTARLQGGRGPAARARFVTWNARTERSDGAADAPWPGRLPPPAPAVVHPTPLRAELADARGEPVGVSARGLLTADPGRLSVAGGAWTDVRGWAGPWPSDERWWSRSRHRAARLQAVTDDTAHLLLAERGRWWVEATYG